MSEGKFGPATRCTFAKGLRDDWVEKLRGADQHPARSLE
jgi:hypothetical protein